MPQTRYEPPQTDPTGQFARVSRVIDSINTLAQYKPELGAQVTAVEGEFKRLAPRATGQVCFIPAASPANYGQQITLFVSDARGTLQVKPVDGLIDGLASVSWGVGTYLIILRSDGSSGWATTQSLGALPIIAAGTQLGRPIDGGSGPPIALTGAQQGQNSRFAPFQTTVALGSVALNDTACGLLCDVSGNLTNITGNSLDGRTIMLRVGSGFNVAISHLAGGSGEIACPGAVPYLIGSRSCVYLRNEVGIWRVIDRKTEGLASLTANASTTNSAANNTIATFTAPADTLLVGDVYRVAGNFTFVDPGATTPTLTFELLIGGAVVNTVVVTPVLTAATFHGRVLAEFTVRSVGAGGTVMTAMHVAGSGLSLAGAFSGGSQVDTATDAVDTTVSRVLELRARMTTAVAGATLTFSQGYWERPVRI